MATETDSQTTAPTAAADIQENWRVLMAVGAVLGLLGTLAIFAPFLTGVALSLSLGVLFVAGGFAHVAHAVAASGWTGAVWQALLALVYAAVGVSLLVNPLLGLATLTVLLVTYLVVSGLVEIGLGFRTRPNPQWAWVVASGVLSLLVAGLLWVGLPTTALWAVGLLVGVSLLSTGISTALLANAGRKAAGTVSTAEEAAPGT